MFFFFFKTPLTTVGGS